ncbi:MAG: circularly permuted type 2 ATP-grasp protein [bacterium]|nr:circularly permuted type 2 ATP-grasp protein [bacterium]
MARDLSDAPLFGGYTPLVDTWDEFFTPDGTPHPHAGTVVEQLERLGRREFRARQRLADATFLRGGITFSVYSDRRGAERIFPFDLIPRVIDAAAWERVERGLTQRVQALNAFLADVYDEQRILAEGVVPADFVLGAKGYLKEMRGVRAPGGVRVAIAGIDLIQGPDGEYVVLEDNARTPSGVSYVLENRAVMKKVFPGVFADSNVQSVEEYPLRLVESLGSLGPDGADHESIAVLTPGVFNSAYFEHSFLARRMGVPLVEGRDLFVDDDHVYAKTTLGPRRIDVLYRRLDDPFLDPEAFRKDSLLGVPGLVRAYAKGNVALANAIGNGVADDKGIYPFVPDMIRFYLSEEPILRQVETYVCAREEDRRYVQENLSSLVVKSVNEAGGYGMLIGPQASRRELAEFRAKIDADPRNYIAQPRIELSTCPTWTRKGIAPRRVDLRPYVLTGANGTWVLPGGLTRVALVEGSYVVNSSQGGGSKDTWVLRGADARPPEGEEAR